MGPHGRFASLSFGYQRPHLAPRRAVRAIPFGPARPYWARRTRVMGSLDSRKFLEASRLSTSVPALAHATPERRGGTGATLSPLAESLDRGDWLGPRRAWAKKQADAQLSALLQNPFMVAATVHRSPSAGAMRQARGLTSEQRQALQKLRTLCETFIGLAREERATSSAAESTQPKPSSASQSSRRDVSCLSEALSSTPASSPDAGQRASSHPPGDCTSLLRQAQELRAPLAGLVTAEGEVNLSTRFIVALTPYARLHPLHTGSHAPAERVPPHTAHHHHRHAQRGAAAAGFSAAARAMRMSRVRCAGSTRLVASLAVGLRSERSRRCLTHLAQRLMRQRRRRRQQRQQQRPREPFRGLEGGADGARAPARASAVPRPHDRRERRRRRRRRRQRPRRRGWPRRGGGGGRGYGHQWEGGGGGGRGGGGGGGAGCAPVPLVVARHAWPP